MNSWWIIVLDKEHHIAICLISNICLENEIFVMVSYLLFNLTSLACLIGNLSKKFILTDSISL